MANLKFTSLVLVVFILVIFTGQVAQSQCDDSVIVTIDSVDATPCTPQRVDIPVYMDNPCTVGGFEFRIRTTQPWLGFTPGDPDCADTIGSRISGWDMFSANVHAANPRLIIVTGIADMPGGLSGAKLFPGDGLLFTMHLNYNNNLLCDTSQVFEDSVARASDTSGYILYPVKLNHGSFTVLPGSCGNNPRGDANCSGALNGVDVSYLVAYFKGTGPGFCCLCSGDANSSGNVNGIDVTYLVAYFKGGPAPGPCH